MPGGPAPPDLTRTYDLNLEPMKKLVITLLFALISASLFTTLGQQRSSKPSFNVVEASIPEMQKAMKEGRLTSHELVTQYLIRIATYNQKLRAAITVNPNALSQADQLDRERQEGHIRGPLHGIPIALKDNIL